MKDTPRVTVPVEPTEAMINHAVGHIGGGSTFDTDDRREIAQSVYRAMLSAAPAPEGGAVSESRFDVVERWAWANNGYREFVGFGEIDVTVVRSRNADRLPFLQFRLKGKIISRDRARSIIDKSWADEIALRPALATREEAPAEAGELASQIAILRKAANSPTPDEDAGLTPESALKSAQAWRAIASNVVAAFDRAHPAPDALRVAVEALEAAKPLVMKYAALSVAPKIAKALAALQAEQKGGA